MGKSYEGENFISKDEKIFLEAVSDALHGKQIKSYDDETSKKMFERFTNSSLGAIAFQGLCDIENDNCVNSIKEIAKSTSFLFYRNLMITRNVLWLLEQNGIEACVLKGIDFARFYSIPEYRSFIDVDILVCDDRDFEKAVRILEINKYTQNKKQYSPHHVIFKSVGGTELELHKRIARPFGNDEKNAFLNSVFTGKDIYTKAELFDCEFTVLRDGEKAFYMLLHMLEHFMGAGFGIRLLCDWTLFWEQNLDDWEVERYLHYVNKAGLKTFSDVITGICVKWMGLNYSFVKRIYDDTEVSGEVMGSVLKDILDTGKSSDLDKSRLVSAESDSVFSLLKEFNHQTKVNFPKASKCFLLMPVLWIASFAVFMSNNRKKRGVSLTSVLKSTRDRSRVTKNLYLWEK